jgi:hypothetical protein
MVNGRVNRVVDAARLANDRELQQRLLGVGRHGHETEPIAEPGDEDRPPEAAAPRRGPRKIYMSNPTLPTRWSQPAPVARIEASARTDSGAARSGRRATSSSGR